MQFLVDLIEKLDVSDDDLSGLLTEVYVQAGFTSPETAKSIFEPTKVRSRGFLFVAIEKNSNELAGMVIVVPWDSPAAVKAKEAECEMHLLGVSQKYRGYGLGRKLVETALQFASERKFKKMILWTQKPMKAAQSLYMSSGFAECGEMTRNGIEFLVYERQFAKNGN